MSGKEKEVKKNNTSKEWKNVAIGSAAGIMFGAGSAYAAGKLSDGSVASEDSASSAEHSGHDVTVEASDVAAVNQGQSFDAAFAQARAAVGSGGVFRWHGGVYGTYTKDEWDAMSPEEQQQFSQNAMRTAGTVSEGSTSSVETAHVQPHQAHEAQQPQEAHQAHEGAGGSQHAQNANANGETGRDGSPQPGTENQGNAHQTAQGDNDVHVVGVHEEQLGDGSVVTVGTIEGAGSDPDILVVDLNRDDTFDVAMSDLNNNGQIDDGEVVDISGIGLRVPNAAADPNLHTALNEDLAPGMPDYMNDADVQTV